MIPITNGKIRIMIVEDNDDTAKFEMQVLTKVGFETVRVADGAIAFDQMKSFKPNIVVLDLELPGKTGDIIQEEMLKDSELKDIPVIVNSVHMTDSSDSDNLGNKYMWVHHRYTGQMSNRIVRKLSNNPGIKDLLIEVTIACGDAYNVMPLGLKEYWQKSDPNNIPQFKVI